MRDGEWFAGFLWCLFTVLGGVVICACTYESNRKDRCANDTIYERNILTLDNALRSWRAGRRAEMMNKWYSEALLKQQEWRNLHVYDRTHTPPPPVPEQLPVDKANINETRYDPFARAVLIVDRQGEFVCADRDYKMRKTGLGDIIVQKKTADED